MYLLANTLSSGAPRKPGEDANINPPLPGLPTGEVIFLQRVQNESEEELYKTTGLRVDEVNCWHSQAGQQGSYGLFVVNRDGLEKLNRVTAVTNNPSQLNTGIAVVIEDAAMRERDPVNPYHVFYRNTMLSARLISTKLSTQDTQAFALDSTLSLPQPSTDTRIAQKNKAFREVQSEQVVSFPYRGGWELQAQDTDLFLVEIVSLPYLWNLYHQYSDETYQAGSEREELRRVSDLKSVSGNINLSNVSDEPLNEELNSRPAHSFETKFWKSCSRYYQAMGYIPEPLTNGAVNLVPIVDKSKNLGFGSPNPNNESAQYAKNDTGNNIASIQDANQSNLHAMGYQLHQPGNPWPEAIAVYSAYTGGSGEVTNQSEPQWWVYSPEVLLADLVPKPLAFDQPNVLGQTLAQRIEALEEPAPTESEPNLRKLPECQTLKVYGEHLVDTVRFQEGDIANFLTKGQELLTTTWGDRLVCYDAALQNRYAARIAATALLQHIMPQQTLCLAGFWKLLADRYDRRVSFYVEGPYSGGPEVVVERNVAIDQDAFDDRGSTQRVNVREGIVLNYSKGSLDGGDQNHIGIIEGNIEISEMKEIPRFSPLAEYSSGDLAYLDADEWDVTLSYVAGQLVRRAGRIYQAPTDLGPAEWNENDWNFLSLPTAIRSNSDITPQVDGEEVQPRYYIDSEWDENDSDRFVNRKSSATSIFLKHSLTIDVPIGAYAHWIGDTLTGVTCGAMEGYEPSSLSN